MGKFCLRDTAGSPERARWLHLARSGSQSQRAIWFILPARGTSHIISWIQQNSTFYLQTAEFRPLAQTRSNFLRQLLHITWLDSLSLTSGELVPQFCNTDRKHQVYCRNNFVELLCQTWINSYFLRAHLLRLNRENESMHQQKELVFELVYSNNLISTAIVASDWPQQICVSALNYLFSKTEVRKKQNHRRGEKQRKKKCFLFCSRADTHHLTAIWPKIT